VARRHAVENLSEIFLEVVGKGKTNAICGTVYIGVNPAITFAVGLFAGWTTAFGGAQDTRDCPVQIQAARNGPRLNPAQIYLALAGRADASARLPRIALLAASA